MINERNKSNMNQHVELVRLCNTFLDSISCNFYVLYGLESQSMQCQKQTSGAKDIDAPWLRFVLVYFAII